MGRRSRLPPTPQRPDDTAIPLPAIIGVVPRSILGAQLVKGQRRTGRIVLLPLAGCRRCRDDITVDGIVDHGQAEFVVALLGAAASQQHGQIQIARIGGVLSVERVETFLRQGYQSEKLLK